MVGIELGVSFSLPKEPVWRLENSVCRTYSTVDALAVQRAVSNPYTLIMNYSSEEMAMMKHRQRGFTLIEVMIVVAIVAILAMVAFPSYQQYMIRAKRSAAQAEMMAISNLEQQFLLANRTYTTTPSYTLSTEVAANYTSVITVDNTATPPTFTITFTPQGAQATDGALTLTNTGVKTPPDKWLR